jgi:transcription elongation factor GreA-like protein
MHLVGACLCFFGVIAPSFSIRSWYSACLITQISLMEHNPKKCLDLHFCNRNLAAQNEPS